MPTDPPRPGWVGHATTLLAIVLAVLLSALLTQHMSLVLGIDAGPESALPVPAVGAILLLVAINALVARLRRGPGLLSRAQLVLVAGGVLMATPLCTQGFWHRFVGTVTTFPRDNQFWVIDAMPDKLWPHGANLLAGSLPEPRQVGEGAPLDLRVPVGEGGAEPSRPYLVSALVRAPDLPEGTLLTCRIIGDGEGGIEAFRLDRPSKPDMVRQDGFQRLGLYGLRLPEAAATVTLRFALVGPGTAEIADPKLMSVAAVESALRGSKPVTPEVLAALPPEQRASAIAAPATLLSADGAAFVASAGVPWGEWAVCLTAWGGFLVLVIGAVVGTTLLMHRHWVEAERLPMPLGRGTSMLLGLDTIGLWRSPWLWGALAAAGVWTQLCYWAGHNPVLPDPTVSVPIKPYFSDPSWGRMWEATFTVHALYLGLALFFELNVLASLVVGFWLYRSLFWFGDATGVAHGRPDYPWRYDICAGAYLAYIGVVVMLARRHLASSARRAFTGGWAPQPGEPASPRIALLLILACLLGAVAWASWVGLGLAGALILFLAIAGVGLVAARLRAECGILFAYFTPYNLAIVLGSFGGIPVFGPQAVLFGLLASMWMTGSTMHIPGMQVENAELARREGVGTGWIVMLPLLAVGLGVVIGGWAFLGYSYGQGGDNLRYAWAFDGKLWYFSGFNAEVSSLGDQSKGSMFSGWGLGIGAGATALVATLRQLFAGFWFHPVGVILGSTHLMDGVWGSCLVALVLRFGVVRFAGAEAVRSRLLPVGIGIFLAGCLVYATAVIHGTILASGTGFSSLMRGVP